MKSKIMAVVLTVVMAVAAVAIVASDDSEAAEPKGEVYVAVGNTVTVDFVMTEPDESYYDNTVTWETSDNTQVNGTEAKKIGSNGEVVASGEYFTVQISEKNDSPGTHTATFTGVSVGAVTGLPLNYECVTGINNSEGVNTVTQTKEFTINVTVLANPLPDATNNKVTITGTVGEVLTSSDIVNWSAPSNDYVYYAIGLPAGVQMTPSGTISGTPSEKVTKGDLIIVATHKDSNLSFKMTYKEAVNVTEVLDSTITYQLTGDNAPGNKGTYVVVEGTNPYVLTTYVNNKPCELDYVYIINNDGTQTTANGNDNGVYDFSSYIAGTGSYKVVLIQGDVIAPFELVVVDQNEYIHTGIGFTPGSP